MQLSVRPGPEAERPPRFTLSLAPAARLSIGRCHCNYQSARKWERRRDVRSRERELITVSRRQAVTERYERRASSSTPSVPLSLSFENRAPLTIPVPERQTQWDGGSRPEESHLVVSDCWDKNCRWADWVARAHGLVGIHQPLL